MKSGIKKEFFKYISSNIMGMIGLSCYILADTYFIAAKMGSQGLTCLLYTSGDFRQATYRAVRHGLKKAKSILLEPVYEFQIDVYKRQIWGDYQMKEHSIYKLYKRLTAYLKPYLRCV